MNTPLNIKKIALIVTGLVVVVALGVFLGRGNLFKGSFIGTESDAIPSPSGLEVTKNAANKYILSWGYSPDASVSKFTYTDGAGDKVPVSAVFNWTIKNSAGDTIVDADADNTAFPLPGSTCVKNLNDPDMGNFFNGYTCQDVVLSDDIVAKFVPGATYTFSVQAYTGVVDKTTDPANPTRQISKYGTVTYMPIPVPTITPANPLDTVAFKGVDPVTGVPQFIDYGWNDASYRAGDTNSKFTDHDASYFGFGWEITDVTITGEAKVILKKDVFGDPGPLSFPIVGSLIPIGMAPFTSEAAAKQTCLMNPSGFAEKIWTCKTGYIGYIPAVEGFIDGHAYVVSVSVYNGTTDVDGNPVASAPKSSKAFVVKATPAKPADFVTFNGVDPVTGVPGAINWGYDTSAANTSNSKFADNFKSYFGFGWEITDVTITGEAPVVFKKDVFGDPGTMFSSTSSPFTSEASARATCSVAPSNFDGNIWTCNKAYVPDVRGYIDGHSYKATVQAYNGLRDVAGNLVPSAPVSSGKFTIKGTPAKSVDYAMFTEVDPVTGVPHFIDWGYDTSAANKSNSKFADNFKSYFGFGWEIADVTITGEAPVILSKGLFEDPGTLAFPSSNPFTSEAMARNTCMVDTIWTCTRAYIPALKGFTNGHSYKATVKAYNGLRDANGLDVGSAPVTTKTFTMKAAKVEVVADSSSDTTAPKVVSATSITPNQVKVVFSEKVKLPAVPESAFSIINTNYKNADGTPGSIKVTGVVLDPDDLSGATVILTTGDQGLGMPYVLTVGNGITDLAGNAIIPGASDTAAFAGTAIQPPVLDYVNVTLPTKAGDKITFAYGWNDSSVKPNAANTFLKDSNDAYQFVYNWIIRDDKGTEVWAGNSPFSKVSEEPICSVPMSEKGLYGWICKNNSIPLNATLKPGQTYTLGVQTFFKSNYSTFLTFSKPFIMPAAAMTPVTPVTPVVVIPPTMTLKNLSVKKLTDGNVALTYTIDLAGKWTATEFSSEVRLNNSKIFVAKFNETVKPGTTTYTYEVVLLPWEIKAGDTLKVFMNASGLNANDYTNDGQSVVYDAGAKILDAVVGLVTANALPSATVGSPYSAAIVVKDGVAPYKYIVGAGSTLPDGLSLDPLTGVLSGTPIKDNAYAFGLSITDAKKAALNATFTLKVVPAPVAGTVVVPAGGGTTIINNYTTYNPVAPAVPAVPAVPVVPATPPSNRFLFPINLGPSLFQDVAYHWARNYINVLWNAGFVQGYTGRTFGPDDSLTRGQLLKIVMESLHYKIPTKVAYSPCVDVQTNQWYAKYFAVAREKGIIGGYTDGTCRPNKITNRAESLKILYAAIAQMPEVPVMKVTATVPAGFRNTFYDLNENSWYYPYFANAQSLGIINGFADETARPDSELSRAQMAKIVVLMMQKLAWAQ